MNREHALIIGGTKGAGRTAVRHFVSEGYQVSSIARHPPTEAAAERANVSYWAVDLRDLDNVRSVLPQIEAAHGKPGCVAFFQRYRGQGDTWAGEIETSLTATKSLIELLVESGLRDCSIVIVSSVNARLISRQLPLGYHVGKAGLNQIVRYFALTLGPRGIRVNSVSPGTFLKEESREVFLQDTELVDLYRRMIPLGRLCTAEEVVQTVIFLASRRSSFITGQDIVVDGGLTLAYQEALVRELYPRKQSPEPASPNCL